MYSCRSSIVSLAVLTLFWGCNQPDSKEAAAPITPPAVVEVAPVEAVPAASPKIELKQFNFL